MTQKRCGALSFDFGKKHIGVATLEVGSRSVQPAGVINANNGRPHSASLEAMVETWQPSFLVVGLPKNMNDTESQMTKDAKKFGKHLEQRFRLPVHFVDERLTSVEAQERMKQSTDNHAMAAAVIAESWLFEHASNV